MIEYLDLQDPASVYPLPVSIKMDPSRCRVFLITTPNLVRLELIGFRDEVCNLRDRIRTLIDELESVEDSITGLTLTQVRILMINKYDREMATLFSGELECDISSKELCVHFTGKRKQVDYIAPSLPAALSL